MVHYYTSISILEWLFADTDITASSFDGDKLLITSGEGPYRKKDLDEFLDGLEFSVFPLEIGKSFFPAKILIIGQEEWNKEDLLDLLDKRRGQTLKVYSQEMFLTCLLTGNDPLATSDRDWIISLSEGHPALEFLLNLGFDWPSTLVFGGGRTEIDDFDWPRIGLMKALGYEVGRSGIQDKKKRRQILKEIYEKENLPSVKSRAYLSKWGSPHSCARLEKMANSIATFCRNAKRDEKKDKTVAIEHWEEDLEWIKTKFYRDHCQFWWPSTKV